MFFIDKYKPTKSIQILGQYQALNKILQYIRGWKKGRAAMIFGQSGAGKTAALHSIAKENNMEIIEMDTVEGIESILPAIKQYSLFRRKKLIIIESADRMKPSSVMGVVKESIFPVFLIVENPYISKLKTIRHYCDIVEFKKVPVFLIERRLAEINEKEGLKYPAHVIKNIAESSEGNMRAAILDLENFVGERDREENIFNVLNIIFKSGDMKKAREAIEVCDKEEFELFRWIEENISSEFMDPVKRALAFNILSKADVSRRRGKRTMDLLAGLCTIGKERAYSKYKPPVFFFRKKDDYSDIAKRMHCSTRKIKLEMPYIRMFLGK
ncbi:MAG: hypothetical protein ISS95_01230 [Candidatus Aenigmarchaeota archaeon]|nr:hypothetical protein [Candidatus Aenigmarchaeota archaeon]